MKVLIKIKHAFLKRFFPDFLLMGLVVPNNEKFEKDTKLICKVSAGPGICVLALHLGHYDTMVMCTGSIGPSFLSPHAVLWAQQRQE